MISAIVAVDNDWGIGFNGGLLEKIPEDMNFFKTMIQGKVLVMGRKTWDSLPKRAFSQRHCIVLSSQCKDTITIPNTYSIYMNYDKCINLLQHNNICRSLEGHNMDIMIIGGGQIYKQLLPYCEKVYVTKIYKDHENIDTYFPNLDESNEWSGSPIGEIQTYEDLSYQFWLYKRI